MNFENNKRLVEEYPFLQLKDRFTGEPLTKCEDYTMLDSMPEGWRKAFGEDICREIKEILVQHNCLDEYHVLQIKEKFGTLRWYGNKTSKEIEEVIGKYELKSRYVCITCGAPATKVLTDWISPFCDECISRMPIDYAYEAVHKYWQWIDEDEE